MSSPLVANRLSAALWYSRCQRRIKTTTIAQNKRDKRRDTCFWALHINLICAADNDANVLGREAARSVPKHPHATVSKMAGTEAGGFPAQDTCLSRQSNPTKQSSGWGEFWKHLIWKRALNKPDGTFSWQQKVGDSQKHYGITPRGRQIDFWPFFFFLKWRYKYEK